jgi:hypothetical protein
MRRIVGYLSDGGAGRLLAADHRPKQSPSLHIIEVEYPITPLQAHLKYQKWLLSTLDLSC